MPTSTLSKKPRRSAKPAHPGEFKTADSKGRVVLGSAFANRVVLVEQVSATEINLKLARVIPEQEGWLYQNPKALASVRQGLQQARSRKFAKSPDLSAGAKLARHIEG